jgi:diacylglycerol O-acyltransferase / wax synthase
MAEHFDEWLSDSDTLMWTIEKDPILRSTIVVVVRLDRAPDPDRLRASLDRATRVVPRLRQVVEVPPLRLGPPRWITAPRFDLDTHLRWIRLTERGPQRTALDVAALAAATAFDKSRPLWELTVVEEPDAEVALVLKVHHSLTDGVGGIEMAAHIFDVERDPKPTRLPPTPAAPAPGRGDLARAAAAEQTRLNLRRGSRYARLALGTAAGAVADPAGTARRAAGVARTAGKLVAPVNEVLSPAMRERSINRAMLTAEVPLGLLKAAARAGGGTLNDAYLAVVTGALRRYHEALGVPVDALRVTMPVNLRVEGDNAGGNRFTPARFRLPVGIADPVERMRAIDGLARAWAKDPGLGVSDELAALLNRLPSTVTTELFGGMLKKVDFVATNVPGSPVPLFLGGAEVTHVFPFAPPSGASVAFGLLSHVQTCCIGITVDTAAVEDLDLLARCVDEGLAEVLALADTPSADDGELADEVVAAVEAMELVDAVEALADVVDLEQQAAAAEAASPAPAPNGKRGANGAATTKVAAGNGRAAAAAKAPKKAPKKAPRKAQPKASKGKAAATERRG